MTLRAEKSLRLISVKVRDEKGYPMIKHLCTVLQRRKVIPMAMKVNYGFVYFIGRIILLDVIKEKNVIF